MINGGSPDSSRVVVMARPCHDRTLPSQQLGPMGKAATPCVKGRPSGIWDRPPTSDDAFRSDAGEGADGRLHELGTRTMGIAPCDRQLHLVPQHRAKALSCAQELQLYGSPDDGQGAVAH